MQSGLTDASWRARLPNNTGLGLSLSDAQAGKRDRRHRSRLYRSRGLAVKLWCWASVAVSIRVYTDCQLFRDGLGRKSLSRSTSVIVWKRSGLGQRTVCLAL